LRKFPLKEKKQSLTFSDFKIEEILKPDYQYRSEEIKKMQGKLKIYIRNQLKAVKNEKELYDKANVSRSQNNVKVNHIGCKYHGPIYSEKQKEALEILVGKPSTKRRHSKKPKR